MATPTQPGDDGWHRPTVPAPEMDEYLQSTLIGDELSSAIDGCESIDADGTCEHGKPSWERYWGII